MRVCHFSSVHPAQDVRIFHKECVSLARAGYDVHWVVADGDSGVSKGVQIHALKPVAGRLGRMVLTAFRVFRAARALRADIYHFHDPELLPWAWCLRLSGAQVIYDAHEDVPRDILSKPWIAAWLRQPLAACFEAVENFLARRMSRVVAATPYIRDRFLQAGCQAVAVSNYPLLEELPLTQAAADFSPATRAAVCYAGGIARVRGSQEMVMAAGLAQKKLLLAGTLSAAEQSSLQALPAWSQVEAPGFLDRAGVAALYAQSFAGLVVLHPEPNYLPSQPVKMYEYMAAGIPVIASDFPLWRELVQRVNCGICVDPLDPAAIAAAIQTLDADREAARAMGERGRQAVLATFNWGVEESALLACYRELAGAGHA